MPSKESPGKKAPIASAFDRLNMLSLSDFANNPKIIIDDYELKSDKPNFTINSIKHIKNKFKKDNIFLALGLDQFNNLSNWHNSNSLKNMVRFICFNRIVSTNSKMFEKKCELVEDFNWDISSSEIKRIIQKNRYLIKDMVNKNIFNYIIDKDIYK